jgi:hypothetical protein
LGWGRIRLGTREDECRCIQAGWQCTPLYNTDAVTSPTLHVVLRRLTIKESSDDTRLDEDYIKPT